MTSLLFSKKMLQRFKISLVKSGQFYSLPALAKNFNLSISRLPVCLRIILEAVLRNCDGKKITKEHVLQLANWKPNGVRVNEIALIVSRIILQDFTGIPLLADLASMRSKAVEMDKAPELIEPKVPVDLVCDHSVQVDYFGNKQALDLNMRLEFSRNRERYQFIKWGMQAFNTFKVVPPGFGIVHQINLEYLARGVHKDCSQDKDNALYYPDTLVGTDSHTTMINAIGVVGWGVGGIEAEAGMLGQPIYFLAPDVVGVELKGVLRSGVTATDLVLTITEMLRAAKVVGKFVEFFGPGTASLSVPDRATIANMAPEYGATMGFFPVDEKTISYFETTGRTQDEIDVFAAYFKAQELFGMPSLGDIDYSTIMHLDLNHVEPSLAGPKRPQDRISLGELQKTFTNQLINPQHPDSFHKTATELTTIYRTANGIGLRNADVLIAAITSCTNTSNPNVLLTAGLLAKKAVTKGLKVAAHIKTSLAPGSRVVTQYLEAAGLLSYLEKLGFGVAAYGCTTCIGNSGDLTSEINEVINKNNLVGVAILSGNRNFEARIHPNIRANFLASPPLVVAYAIAGNMLFNLMTDPLGTGIDGRDVYLGDIWPTNAEIAELMPFALNPTVFSKNYATVYIEPGKLWEAIGSNKSNKVYSWPKSTYIAKPPFFANFSMKPEKPIASIKQARALAIFGDSVTTDHISPAGAIKEASPAGEYLRAQGVEVKDFNSYGARRGNHDVMIRGTFANVRIKNLMLPRHIDGSQEEGGITIHQPSQIKMSIYKAAMEYMANSTPTIIFAGEEYGCGSSRDWAAKGSKLLGVRAVIARSFERIHRSNLVGMGVLPLQFQGQDSIQSLELTGDEIFDLTWENEQLQPLQEITLIVYSKKSRNIENFQYVKLLLRIDTGIEIEYFNHGGILPFVLRQLLG